MTDAARPHYVRARREAEKAERRAAILSAARELLRRTGFEGFSMAALAGKTGIAKATLYLYFETREEVLLALYVETLAGWCRALIDGLRDGMTDAEFVAHFQATSSADPNLMTLRARLESVIEHNVSRVELVAAKRAMRGILEELAPRVERALALRTGTGVRLVLALGALQLGAAQSDLGPAVSALDPPDDVAEFMRLHAEIDPFRDAGPLIVAGMRAAADPSL